jgi:hypothetical protein
LIKIYAKKEIKITASRDDYFRFGLVFIKKNNQTEIFKKKTETGSNRFGSVFSVFSGFGSVFPVWLGFFPGFFRFGFFGFLLIKPKPNRPVF